jgi:hypothetical protein
VDIAVKDGPVLFSNLAFPNAAGPSPVDAGTYDLEVRAAGTDTVALAIDGVQLQAGKIYTVLAVGLLNGEPALEALPIVNDPAAAAPAPAAPAPSSPAAPAPAPALPSAGTGPADSGSTMTLMLAAVAAGLAIAGTGVLAASKARSR